MTSCRIEGGGGTGTPDSGRASVPGGGRNAGHGSADRKSRALAAAQRVPVDSGRDSNVHLTRLIVALDEHYGGGAAHQAPPAPSQAPDFAATLGIKFIFIVPGTFATGKPATTKPVATTTKFSTT